MHTWCFDIGFSVNTSTYFCSFENWFNDFWKRIGLYDKKCDTVLNKKICVEQGYTCQKENHDNMEEKHFYDHCQNTIITNNFELMWDHLFLKCLMKTLYGNVSHKLKSKSHQHKN